MKLFFFKKIGPIIINLKFAITLLLVISGISSLGSIIEQEQSLEFYQKNYPNSKPLFGFIDSDFITFWGLNQIYQNIWFLALLFLLGISLVGCTFTQQIPIFEKSKKNIFKESLYAFKSLPFFISIKNQKFLKEELLKNLITKDFYIYQKKNGFYSTKGVLGRLSPILVHLSLILILLGSTFGGVSNYKAEEFIPKGDIFAVQNLTKSGPLSLLTNRSIRVNDFWIEYKKNKVKQFYSNLSILDHFGNEIKNQTISVNNPLRYKSVDFYQSDWEILGIRVKNYELKKSFEYPVFNLKENSKIWITWIKLEEKKITVIFDNLSNNIYLYNEKGEILKKENINTIINDKKKIKLLEILPGSGILVKSDPSISLIYLGFGILIITTFLSYLPYNQVWVSKRKNLTLIGAKTNRGKIQLELDFENILRKINKRKQIY